MHFYDPFTAVVLIAVIFAAALAFVLAGVEVLFSLFKED